MEKHTPGTWRKVKCQCGFEGCNQYFVEPIRGTDGRLSEADADLVVAAPELLEAIKKVVSACAENEGNQFLMGEGWCKAHEKIGAYLRPFIAKAEGRE